MRKRIVLLLMAFVMLFSSCSDGEDYYTREIYAMDSAVSIRIPSDTSNAEKLCNDVVYYFNELEGKVSLASADSMISQFNATAYQFKAEEEFLDILYYALDIAEKTGGAYDPTLLPLTNLWKIEEGGYLPTVDEVNMTLSNVGYDKLTMVDGSVSKNGAVCVDLSGVVQGFAINKAVTKLSKEAACGMISFGDNVGAWGIKVDDTPWEVKIKDPKNTENNVGKIVLPEFGGYVFVSGDYENYFENGGTRFHSVLDPKSGFPVNNGIHSVAVYSKDATVGDALSTALFVMGIDKAMEFYNSGTYEFEALFVTDDGVKMTKGMEDMFVNEN